MKYLLWRLLRSVLTACLAAWILATLLLWIFQEHLIFPATRGEPSTFPSDWGLPFERHRLHSADGVAIDVWWMPQDQSQALLLFCHGNAGNLGHRLDTFRALHLAGLNVLAFDYRGYGSSEGSPSADGLRLDAERVWDFAVGELGFSPQQIIVHGRSLGGGVAAHLAALHQPGALILESTFTDLVDLASDKLPWIPIGLISRHRFPSRELLAQIQSPVLVLHGRADEIVPYRHGQALFAAAQEPKAFVSMQGDHNSGWLEEGQAWLQAIINFAEAHVDTNTPQ